MSLLCFSIAIAYLLLNFHRVNYGALLEICVCCILVTSVPAISIIDHTITLSKGLSVGIGGESRRGNMGISILSE